MCVKVCGCLRVCTWDEFSEYLLENRVPTSADFNTYPIRIFFFVFTISGRKKLAKTGTTPKLQKFRFRLYAFLAKTKKSSTEKSHFFPDSDDHIPPWWSSRDPQYIIFCTRHIGSRRRIFRLKTTIDQVHTRFCSVKDNSV